jgi:hypothetical protein
MSKIFDEILCEKINFTEILCDELDLKSIDELKSYISEKGIQVFREITKILMDKFDCSRRITREQSFVIVEILCFLLLETMRTYPLKLKNRIIQDIKKSILKEEKK